MKIFIALAIGFFIQDCSTKNTNGIEITLKNKEIYFIENNPEDQIYNDSIDRENAFNVVEVEFKNKGHEKMLLFINPEKDSFNSGYYNDYKYYFGYSCFIETSDNTKPKTMSALTTFSKYPEGLDNIENHKSNIRKKKYKKLNLSEKESIAFEMFERHAFYLGVNETKTVYFHISLPIVDEINDRILQNPFRFTNLKEGWDFKFMYEANSKNIYNDLPEFVKEELRNNQIEIFDGKIVSNAVKLKKR
jgi:hypothetical protein